MNVSSLLGSRRTRGIPVGAALRGTRASDHLDLVRGLAAVAVLLFHVRYRFFADFSEIANPDAVAIVWYVLTAFGHDAVMVFFVVSGFLVGSATIRDLHAERWKWSDYLTARCVRLYVVLLPGLLLTLFWDRLGLNFFATNAIYTGTPQAYHHDFFNVPERLGLAALAGNAAFLQGIVAPTFGSNDALWSLAYEFWYYVAFPFCALALAGRASTPARIFYFVAGIGLLLVAGFNIATYFPIWLLGVIVGRLPSSAPISRRPVLWSALAATIFGMWLLGSHTAAVKTLLGSLWALDVCTGLAFAAWLYILLHDRREPNDRIYGYVARRLAGISYTLYVVHLPFLVFVRAWLVDDQPWRPNTVSLVLATVIAASAMAYAFIIAAVTESKTSAIRQTVDGWRRSGWGKRESANSYKPRPQALP